MSKKSRNKHFVYNKLNICCWVKEFKMTYWLFCKLVDILFLCIKKQDTNMKAAIPIDKAVAIALDRLGYGSTLYMV